MRRSHILGVGHYVPERVVTNRDLMRLMDTSDEWIQQRTGIRERRYSDGCTGAADMGAVAAREALQKAGLTLEQIQCIVFATLSPDVDMPGSAFLLQDKLGIPGIPAFDVRNQCSGFLYALAVADQFVKTGTYDHVLVVGSEVHSSGLDLSTRGRDVAVIFGDGAGAVVLGPSPDPRRGILSTHLHAEGKYAEKLWLEAPGSRLRPRLTEEMITGPDAPIFPRMEGRYVFRHAVTRMTEAVQEALDANGLTVASLDLLIPHQANLRINQMVAMGFGLDEEKVVNNIDRFGNTTAASIPLALYEALATGRLREGMLVCLAAFGAGFTWGSALIRW
ncbi:MAG: 3-oxoacyl-[acyl-carrier-protein] synthase 3 [Candidatus Binatia bacterium]|nr:MAG: 3-oxoacyl-[acyl-carrier-protein] synthase 3 [Candidatus Binatia bacterium]